MFPGTDVCKVVFVFLCETNVVCLDVCVVCLCLCFLFCVNNVT